MRQIAPSTSLFPPLVIPGFIDHLVARRLCRSGLGGLLVCRLRGRSGLGGLLVCGLLVCGLRCRCRLSGLWRRRCRLLCGGYVVVHFRVVGRIVHEAETLANHAVVHSAALLVVGQHLHAHVILALGKRIISFVLGVTRLVPCGRVCRARTQEDCRSSKSGAYRNVSGKTRFDFHSVSVFFAGRRATKNGGPIRGGSLHRKRRVLPINCLQTEARQSHNAQTKVNNPRPERDVSVCLLPSAFEFCRFQSRR